MIFESKYEIGQKLYEIQRKFVVESETCEHCKQDIYHYIWVVDEKEQEIHGVGVSSDTGNIFYKVWRPCVYREHLLESDIGKTYFTSIEEAQAACDRLNEVKQ